MCKTRLRRRFIHGASPDAKFESNREVIIDPAAEEQGPGQPGYAAAAEPKDEQLGATLKASHRGSRREQRSGATRGARFGTTGRSRGSGKPDLPGGNPGRIDQRRYRSSEETGQPEDSNTVTRKGERIEATRGTAGRHNRKIEEARRRGEPIGRPAGRGDSGRPEDQEPAKPRARE